jgi:hypothetical protein
MMVKIALFVVTMIKVARLGSDAPYAGNGRIKTVLGQIPSMIICVIFVIMNNNHFLILILILIGFGVIRPGVVSIPQTLR